MTNFVLGQRVRTLVDAPAMWSGAPAAPAGSLGTIAGPPGSNGSYGVALDADPDMPSDYRPDEIAAA